MSEEKPLQDSRPADEPVHVVIDNGDAQSIRKLPPAAILAFVIIALLGVLIAMLLRGQSSSDTDARIAALKAEYNALLADSGSMGMSGAPRGAEPIDQVAARMRRDAETMVSLATGYQNALAEKNEQLSARNAEILRGEKLRASLAAEASRLQSELQRALVNGSDADLLRRNVEDLKAQRDLLARELEATRQQLKSASGGVSADDYALLKRRYEETLRAKEFFESRVAELEANATKAKLFASSESELLPAAVELFRELRTLEGKADSEISTAYSSLGARLGASVLQTLNFATGKSEVSLEYHQAIQKIVDETPDGDLLMAIGYASETGNVDANRVLSSDRATAAAQMISSLKRPGQFTQAVYLGQTDRFSSRIPERNQIVEIWQIRKK